MMAATVLAVVVGLALLLCGYRLVRIGQSFRRSGRRYAHATYLPPSSGHHHG